MRRTDHWITQLKGTKIPHEHMVFDTEARIVKHGNLFEHRFACSVVKFIGRYDDVYEPHVLEFPFEDAGAHWKLVAGLAEHHGKLTVWAHNLAYDLRVSDALHQLVELGWDLEAISLVPQATWCSWKRGKTTLTLLDTMSWLPGPLSRIARELGIHRSELAYVDASMEELRGRCRKDTAILSKAVCRVLNYLQDEDLGNFRPTGSGQSHAALRRRFLPERSIRVHTDHRALVAEREAMHAGRCECWRHGPIKETLYEYDMNLAYCRIAAGHQVPGALGGERADLAYSSMVELLGDYCVLADLDVWTEEPVVPVTTDDGVIWPVGHFRTTLWDPELLLLNDPRFQVQIHRAWLYRRTDALQAMCLWLIRRLDADPSECGVLEKHMLKHWARTVVGRCGLRYRSWEYFGEHPRPDLCLSYEPNDDTGEVEHNMRIGRQMLQLAALSESHSSVPAIPGWVASKCRARLWKLIELAGAEHVYYMDTDGLLVDAKGRNHLRALAGGRGSEVLLLKDHHVGVTLHGPRNVELGEERRLSGVPRKAIRLDELTFEGETWSGLEYALSAGRTDVVEVSHRLWNVQASDKRRIHLPEGLTEPHRLEIT